MASSSITQLLLHYSSGDKNALERLLPLIYQELRRLAAGLMKREKANHTLQPTALVHEAYFRLVDQKEAKWQNRAHFFAVCAQLMRRILIDHARAKKAEKRGGKDQIQIAFDEGVALTAEQSSKELVELDEALKRLAKVDERKAKVVELRYFGGLSIEEASEVLGTSPATVKRDWTTARAWLLRELAQS